MLIKGHNFKKKQAVRFKKEPTMNPSKNLFSHKSSKNKKDKNSNN
jgi:hypothetical protein